MSTWIELSLTELVADYRAGAGMGQLARAYEVSRSTIRNRLVGLGIRLRRHGDMAWGNRHARKRGGPLCICAGGYWGTLDRRKQRCLVHRGCWEAHHGPIPEGFHVHHVDGDTCNNRIENLVCLSLSEHRAIHSEKKEVK